MDLETFKEALGSLGIEYTMFRTSVVVPCYFSAHPNLPKGKTANFIAYGKGYGECAWCGVRVSLEEAFAMLAANREAISPRANEASPEKEPDNKIGFRSVGDILAMEFEEDEWLVENLLPLPSLVALSGMPGDFKTWITMHLALCVARELPVFGKFPSSQGSVLVIDEENHLRHLQKRFQSLGFRAEDPIKYLSLTDFKADNQKRVGEIRASIKENKFKLVIVDSLIRVHDADENDSRGMAKVMYGLKEFTKEGATVLFTHHHRKQVGWGSSSSAQNLRGSSDILAAVDNHFMLERKKDSDSILVLREPKSRNSEAIEPFEIKILKDEVNKINGFEYVGGYDEKKKKAEEAAEAVAEFLRSEGLQSRPKIHEALSDGFGEKAVDEGLKIATEKGTIEQVPKDDLPEELRGDRKNFYRIREIQ